jgi:hypothetical protein
VALAATGIGVGSFRCGLEVIFDACRNIDACYFQVNIHILIADDTSRIGVIT